MNGVPFSASELAKLYELKARGLNPPAIAKAMNKKVNSIYHRLRWDAMTAEQREDHKRKQAGWHRERVSDHVIAETPLTRPTPEMLRDRDMRAVLPHRDLTAAFFNDPPVGLSALEGRR